VDRNSKGGIEQPNSKSDEVKISVIDEEFYTIYEKVKKALKGGQFDNELRHYVTRLDDLISENSFSNKIRESDELRYFKSKSMLAEAYDYFGRIKSSDELLDEGSNIFDQLQDLKDVEPGNRKIIREKIWFCLHHAHAFLFRKYKYSEAKERVSWCRDFVTNKLRDEIVFPCYGTLALAEYYLGRIHRRLNEYDEAEKCFGRAIIYYGLRAKRKKEEYENDESNREAMHQELTLSEYKSAICLGIGIGWVSFARGRLNQAIYHNILPARVLLLRTGDKLRTAYLDLLFGAALRSKAGREDKDKNLPEAIENIESAYQVFKEHKHIPYTANAALELALAYLYNSEFDKALSKLIELESELKEEEDKSRWKCPRLLVRSRISRKMGNHEEAERLASEALAHAEQTDNVPYKIEASIVRSDARIALGRIEEARDDLCNALKLNKRGAKQANPKVEAICQLHLARIYALEHDGPNAKSYFRRWKRLKQKVEHGVIRELARDVKKEIESLSKDFVIPADTKSLKYNDHLKDLQKFLVNQAKQRAYTIQETTKELKISRQTLHQWRKDIKG
jgi:tetratricopeptide (TPR) repeat protein